MQKKMYVIQLNTGEYYCGYKHFDKQLRKAKIYHSLKFAQDIVDEYTDYKPEVLEVTLAIVPPVSEKCYCFHEEFGKTVCYGTKEREVCSCDGNKNLCNFYSK